MIELSLNHPEIWITPQLAKSDAGRPISAVLSHLRGVCYTPVEEATSDRVGADADLVVFATPDDVVVGHTAPLRLSSTAVIEYSSYFRFA